MAQQRIDKELNNQSKQTEARPEIRPEVEVGKPETEAKPRPVITEEKPAKEAVEKQAPAVRPKPAEPEPSAPPLAPSRTYAEIERVLDEDLEPIYSQMASREQKEFKQKEAETATAIEGLLRQIKFKTKNVLELIVKWLKLIPGVNKFFLEQEAKIKTDKIIDIRERERDEKPQK
ncbi:MAG TPA: hypothetical protein VGA49_01370 [Patescibacteria group bacterium]